MRLRKKDRDEAWRDRRSDRLGFASYSIERASPSGNDSISEDALVAHPAGDSPAIEAFKQRDNNAARGL